MSTPVVTSYRETGVIAEWTTGPRAGTRRAVRLYVDGNSAHTTGTYTERTIRGEWTECVTVVAEKVIATADVDTTGLDRRIARHRKAIADTIRLSAEHGVPYPA